MISEEQLIEMEERAAQIEYCGSEPISLNKQNTEWEFTKTVTRRKAETQTCQIFKVSLRRFHDALRARDSRQARDHGAAQT